MVNRLSAFPARILRRSSSRGKGHEEDAETETVNVEKWGLRGGDGFKKDAFKETTIRLIAQVTARGVKRD